MMEPGIYRFADTTIDPATGGREGAARTKE